jgi:hypothetical protein
VEWAVVASSIQLLSACMKDEPPGDLIGAYHVDGALTENTCGTDALPAADTLNFDVEIRKDDQGRGLWLLETPPAHTGALHDDGSFQFALESSYDVPTTTTSATDAMFERDPDPEQLADPEAIDRAEMQAAQSCRLLIDESISGTMLRVSDEDGAEKSSAKAGERGGDSGADDPGSDLIGENEISIRVGAGSGCNRVLSAQGGPFLALPCRAHYDLTGTLAGE